MRFRNLIAILFFLSAGCSSAQPADKFTGTWEGTLNVGIELRIVFHIKGNGAGGWTATADSPDQSAYGMKCDTTYISNETLTIEMHNLQASFTGKMINDSTIEGTFKQVSPVPLVLRKGTKAKVADKVKPQTPQPPFPYNSYEVEYDNADKTVHFGGTLTVPKPDPNIKYIKVPEYPVAIMITGSGQQDRDETILGHKPFAVIADHLTKNGIAVLRVDDRGVGKTTGDVKHSTSADFAKDVEAGIAYLKTRSDIDKNKIGLIGHSEGGMIAPMVAVETNDVSFMILLAAPGIKIIDLMGEQNEAILKSAGVDEVSLKNFIPVYKNIVTTIVNTPDSLTAHNKSEKILSDWLAKADKPTKDALGFTNPESEKEYINGLVAAMYNPWFHYFLLFDPQPYLQKMSCKILALNGSRDIQVISSSNLAGIEAALKKSKTKNFEIKELPGLNHLFQTCRNCTVNEYGSLEETISPVVLQIMTEWINKNVK